MRHTDHKEAYRFNVLSKKVEQRLISKDFQPARVPAC